MSTTTSTIQLPNEFRTVETPVLDWLQSEHLGWRYEDATAVAREYRARRSDEVTSCCALRTWTTCTSRRVRSTSSTCTESFSRAVATVAPVLLFLTRIYTSRQQSSPAANAAIGFARTSAGSAKCPLAWIESTRRWMTVRFLLQLEPQVWSNPPRASSPTSLVVRGQSTWGRRTLRIHPRSRNVMWAKRARCYPAYSLRGEW